MSFLGLFLACASPTWSERFAADPEQTRKELSAITDPLEQITILEQINQDHVGKTELLCDILKDEQQKEYCIERNKRPHLWTTAKEKKATAQQRNTQETACHSQFCLQEEAFIAAKEERAERAVAICLENQSTKWQSECIFAVAERVIKAQGARGYAIATELCSSSQDFSENCQQHLIQQLAQFAPDANTEAAWTMIFSAHNAIESSWSWRDKKRMERYHDRLWSEALGVAYSGIQDITGNPFDTLPEKYWPHIRAAASYRLFQIVDQRTKTLGEWTEELEYLLTKRNRTPEKLNQQRKFIAAPNLGTTERLEQPAITYLATSQRYWSTNTEEDIQICILEASIRRPPINTALHQDALYSAYPLVKQTAARLQPQLQGH